MRLKDGQFIPRQLNGQDDDEGAAGFLYVSSENPWPPDDDSVRERLPDEWLEEHQSALVCAWSCLVLRASWPVASH